MDKTERWLKKNDPLYGKKESGYLTKGAIRRRHHKEIPLSCLHHMSPQLNMSDEEVIAIQELFT